MCVEESVWEREGTVCVCGWERQSMCVIVWERECLWEKVCAREWEFVWVCAWESGRENECVSVYECVSDREKRGGERGKRLDRHFKNWQQKLFLSEGTKLSWSLTDTKQFRLIKLLVKRHKVVKPETASVTWLWIEDTTPVNREHNTCNQAKTSFCHQIIRSLLESYYSFRLVISVESSHPQNPGGCVCGFPPWGVLTPANCWCNF